MTVAPREMLPDCFAHRYSSTRDGLMRFLFARVVIVVHAVACVAGAVDSPAGVEFFEAKIRPVLVEHCYACHSAQSKRLEGGLRLDSPASIRQGGESGAIVFPGKPAESSLIAAVAYSPDASNMPPRGKLPQRVIDDFRQWVAMGAPLPPESSSVASAPSKRTIVIDQAARDFWSFRPLQTHPRPVVADATWPRRKLDGFIRHKLEQEQLAPAPSADRRTLIRRLSFDLLGLPPTYEEVESFVADTSSDAYEQLVERLLASPHYGERWARHWLDLARYGEDHPTNESTCKPPRFAYQYRDWVVRALNDDLPYDEFVRRQLAADLQPGLPPSERAATGFLGLSPVYHKEPKLAADVIAVIAADEWDERVDMLTRSLLGLTVACARCHDHKFDPIRTQDYYALAGVMASTRLVELPLVEAPDEIAWKLQDNHEAMVDTELRLSYAKTMQKTAQESRQPTEPYNEPIRVLDEKLKALKAEQLFSGPIANGVRDASVWIDGTDPAWTSLVFRARVPRDLPVFVRGNPARPGEIVPRRFIEALSKGPPQPFKHGSGRLELANAIVGEARGLTARVIVNRVWGWHFGQPLVRTPSNLGALGDAPSHPELLDDLAARFVDANWSLKWLHREMLLSATYRLSAVHPLALLQHDPASKDGGNRWLWKMNRRRLESEAWRDAVLKVTGVLDMTMSGPSLNLDDAKNTRRTIYGKVSRQNVADVLRLFDFPDAKQHAEERLATTTPLQQLYLLNSTFMQQSATTLAARATQAFQSGDARLQALFRWTLQRDPTEAERNAAQRLLESPALKQDEAWRLMAHGLLASNEFLYVD